MNDERQHNRANGNGVPGGLPLDALLSAYLDDRESLQPEERARVETLLASDAEAQRMYAELQVVVRELGRLEAVPAPRSYHLDPEMVGAPEPVRLTATSAWYARHASTVRWATAAAAVIFVFVLSADLVLNGVFSDPSSSGDEAGSMPVEQSQLSGEREAADDGGLESASGAAEATAAGLDSGPADAEPDADAGGDESSSAEAETLAEPPDEPAADVPEEEADAGDDSDDFDGGAEEEQAEEALSPEPVPTAEIAITEDSAGGAVDDADVADDPLPEEGTASSGDDTARTSEEAAGESDDEAAAPDTLAFEEAAANEDGGSDRQIWRIAEFSLIVILALLITALIILPRMARAPTRR